MISNFLVRDKPIALEFVISPTCSYQTTFELLRKASLKLLTFKTVFDYGFRQRSGIHVWTLPLVIRKIGHK